MDSKELALRCLKLADNKKAETIVLLDVRKLSSVTDYFLIATGTSLPHLRAIVDEIEDGMKQDSGLRPRTREGGAGETWIVLDYFDVIVHVMRGDIRERFDLEGLWRDAPRIEPGAPEKPSEPRARPARPRAKATTAKRAKPGGPRKKPAATPNDSP